MKHRYFSFLITQLVAGLVFPVTINAATVTTCNEAGLRAAIAQGGTVDFACDGTIVLTNTIEVINSITLDGTGRQVVISGGGLVRLFQVNTGVVFSAKHLTFSDGRDQGTNATGADPVPGEAGEGAGFLVLGGSLNLFDCSLSNHVAQGAESNSPLRAGGQARGGAICAFGAQITLTNCVLFNNGSKGGLAYAFSAAFPAPAAGGALGGAIYAQGGNVAVYQTDFRANIAIGGPVSGGGMIGVRSGPAGQALGGALYATSGIVVVSRSLLVGNRASGGQAFDGPGGGVARGGALSLVAGTSEISGTQFLSNSVQGGGGGRLAPGGEGSGGAIHNLGHLVLSECRLSANATTGGLGNASLRGIGGAISSFGNCVIEESLLDNNRATGGNGVALTPFGAGSAGTEGCGGAIYVATNLALANVTLFGNQAIGGQGGINFGAQGASGAGQGGGVCVAGGTASLTHVTIAQNSALGGVTGPTGTTNIGPAQGGGIVVSDGIVAFLSSIVSSNLAGSNCFGVVIDGGHNISSDDSCHFSATGSLNNTDPLLGPLADNGGPTPSMALLAGSPAIDAADPAGCPSTDQRGIARPFGFGCDIGAFEFSTPSSPGRLFIERIAIGTVRGTFAGEANQTFRVDVSENLTAWSPYSTNTTASSGLFEFFDTNSAIAEPRIFRVSKP